ncbi:MAG: transketolase [Rhodospirillaceae bacterium]|nr:transketolase [Rhodospirillaceae bacterium]HAA93692.1 transketolase [Rhodospirillaceae bacterium]
MTATAAKNKSGVSHGEMANAIRALSMDAVQAANSGHPGAPMGMADIATVLFTRYLKYDPADPNWADRDRFVLSNGHASMLLYSLLHLTGYDDMDIDQVRNFRQLGSRTAGHPEFGHAAGIETTTGPLGQGIANAVGMALAERLLNAHFGSDIVDHNTYVFAGDGCLMEGISHEAISLAGHLKLGKLIVLFDDNEICIDGATSMTVTDDQQKRFDAAGWHTDAIDGHDPDAIAAAIEAAQADGRPSMIACRTVIGFGAPNKQGSEATHGAPLGEDEIAAARKELDWPHDPFVIPNAIADAWKSAGARGSVDREAWQSRLDALDAGTKEQFARQIAGDLPEGWEQAVSDLKKSIAADPQKIATRQASKLTLDSLTAAVPEMIGGSADLTGSNLTKADGMDPVTANDFSGRYIYYGVREHGMAAAMNGMALHGGVIPYGGTFLIFTDYCRPSIRLSALMNQRVIYVMTHDSIGLGEDGPTHQPVEHLAALRAMPNVKLFRPADTTETAECWALALENADGPSVIALTRQGVEPVRTEFDQDNISARGAYILSDADGDRQATIIASGSEIEIALAARNMLQQDGVPTAVVSAPCLELFDQQDEAYRNSVLGPDQVRVAVEAAAGFGWERYIGSSGAFIGMTSFGASAPAGDLYKHFGITAEAVADAVKSRM